MDLLSASKLIIVITHWVLNVLKDLNRGLLFNIWDRVFRKDQNTNLFHNYCREHNYLFRSPSSADYLFQF